MPPVTIAVEVAVSFTHLFGEGAVSVCCGRTAFDLDRSDRMTTEPNRCTCPDLALGKCAVGDKELADKARGYAATMRAQKFTGVTDLLDEIAGDAGRAETQAVGNEK